MHAIAKELNRCDGRHMTTVRPALEKVRRLTTGTAVTSSVKIMTSARMCSVTEHIFFDIER